jgi:hypothetical protein
VADKSVPLILEALSHVMACAEGLPLHGTKTSPGLFPTTVVGKQAAQRCLQDGLLSPRLVTSQPDSAIGQKSKPPAELFVPTEKGINYLFSLTSPRQVLEDLLRVLEQRQEQVASMAASCRQMQTSVDALRTSVEQVLPRVIEGTTSTLSHLYRTFRQDAPATTSPADERTTLTREVRELLSRWQASGASEDCSLPELYRQMRSRRPGFTIGQFHDLLRVLHETEQVYLHPWTGPLYDLPEPPQALLVGHMIAYYASLRVGVEMPVVHS